MNEQGGDQGLTNMHTTNSLVNVLLYLHGFTRIIFFKHRQFLFTKL